jgi:DNA-binding ferritin-like protein
MKLTASQLRRIIKEEVSRVLSESRTEGEIMADVERIGQEWVNMTGEVVTMNIQVAALLHQRQSAAAVELAKMAKDMLEQSKAKQQELTELFKEFMEVTGRSEDEVTKHMTGTLARLAGR